MDSRRFRPQTMTQRTLDLIKGILILVLRVNFIREACLSLVILDTEGHHFGVAVFEERTIEFLILDVIFRF